MTDRILRWFYLAGVLILALFFVAGSVWLIRLSLPASTVSAAPPARDKADVMAALQTLPLPWLSDDDVVDAPFAAPNIWPPPAIDGYIAPGEYAGAGKVTFPGHGGDVEVFFNQDGSNLHVAFDIPLFDLSGGSTYADVYLDTDKDGDGALDGNDYLLRVRDDGVTREYTPTVAGLWGGESAAISWTAAITTNLIGGGWQVEFQIQYDKLGITAGTFKEVGLALGTVNGGVFYWPSGAYQYNPDEWGSLVSSSDWTTFYWKPGPWEDYAPSGMPDFDQRQDAWSAVSMAGPISTHCGPVAMANSLWWFDSKFETPGHSPPGISDTYRLVRSYNPGVWDDHDPLNVGGMGTPGLVDDLAFYFDTNGLSSGGGWLGTRITDMYTGTLDYLRDHGLWDDYIVTLVISPSFDWVAQEVLRSEDVILLLGFYEDLGGAGVGPWVRVAGHYVNVAGVDPAGLIAFSDPFVDGTENGIGIIPPGRVLSGTLLPHQPIGFHTFDTHNDAGNVSHDVYPVLPTNSPGGTWGPDGYPVTLFEPWLFAGVNPHPFTETLPWTGNPIQVEVEFALTVSPFDWKASGEWLPEEDPVYGVWQPWQDYAPNGVPDIDQKQDNWGTLPGPPPPWTFCGPVAAANSLWWFDSKFEPTPIGPPLPPPYGTIPGNDNYPLVQSYDPGGVWDDHDPLNVDDSATPWGGMGFEFVEDLAVYLQTDQVRSGTVITDLYLGLEQYIINHDLRQGYVITQVKSPDFWWVAEEVEVSEDVILLLGFWQEQPAGSGNWVRLGGHYVTLPGVDKQGGFVAFSDPWYDRFELTWPYAGIGSLPGWPSYMGRTGDGWLVPHPIAHTGVYTLHNDAGNVSHDVYNVVGTDSPGGVWGPEEYVNLWLGEIENFFNQNGEEDAPPPSPSDPVQAEVDWAVAVSPVADVWITKDVTPTNLVPGDWLTFTLTFGNDGSLPAEDVAITDALPSLLVNASWEYWVSNGQTVTARSGATFAWDLPDLAWREWGLITVTARVNPALSSGGVFTNEAQITTGSVEQYQVPPLSNVASDAFNVTVSYGVNVTPAVDTKYGQNGNTVVYTFTVQNTGNVPDSYSLSLADDDWLTALSNNSVGPLGVNATTTFQVSVTVPGMAVGATFDQAGVTAQSITSPTVSDTSTFTTTAIANYATHLTPEKASLVENPGQTVTYTLTLYNDGNITDTYNLTHTAASWSTSLSNSVVGPLAPWDDESFEVYVTIPGAAGDGASDAVTVTAQSGGAPALSDSSVLTTVATTQPITRGVALAPPAAAQTGETGTSVTYTLRVTNTGTVADGVVLTATGNWATSLSDYSLNLNSGQGATVYAYVDVPSSGVNDGDQDTATVTARSGADPSKTASSVLTTTARVPAFGVDVTPASDQRFGNPGQTITYTLFVENTGNAVDSYDLALGLRVWPTTLSSGSVGPLDPGQKVSFQVYVIVPGAANDGDDDSVAVTATSQRDPGVDDTATLTTTATTQAITRGVEIALPAVTGSGAAGDAVRYTLTVTNTGNLTDTITLEATGNAWRTQVSPDSVALPGLASSPVVVTVTIPATATASMSDTAVIRALATGASDSSTLTTTVTAAYLYLPLVVKNYP